MLLHLRVERLWRLYKGRSWRSLLAHFYHIIHHKVVVFSVLLGLGVVTQTHLQIEGVHRYWVIYQRLDLLVHLGNNFLL